MEQAMKVLVVDDERQILDELRSFLSRRGHSVMCVDGVVAAIHTLGKDGPFDVLLTDIRMPDGSGLEVLRACLDLQPGAVRYVMSGHAGPEEIAQARIGGALDYFPKPVALRSLMQVLADMAQARNGQCATRPVKHARGR